VPFRIPATRLADVSLFLEILGLSDLIADPTARPATMTGIMIDTCAIELAQLLPELRRHLYKDAKRPSSGKYYLVLLSVHNLHPEMI